MSLVPMYLGPAHRAIRQSYNREAFQLTPATVAKTCSQFAELSNSRTNRDGYYLAYAADNFELLIHCVHPYAPRLKRTRSGLILKPISS